jgi:hypothetical protein
MLLTGRERDFLAGYAYPSMSATSGAVTEYDALENPEGFAAAMLGFYRTLAG